MVPEPPESTASQAAPPVAPQVFEAPQHWRCIDFLSDLHLQAGLPRTLAGFRRYLQETPADAVFILGDLFEAWVGDDAAAEAGFERECAAWLAQAARGRFLAFMAGNRDFLIGVRFLQECGLHGLQDPTLLSAFGQQILLSHGDALCLDDHDYQHFRATVRDPAWQAAFLAQPLSRRRDIAAGLRAESRRQQGMRNSELWADVDPAAAASWLNASGAGLLIHGHTHRPGRHELAPGLRREVLGDWDLEAGTAAEMRGDVLRLERNGLRRLPAVLWA